MKKIIFSFFLFSLISSASFADGALLTKNLSIGVKDPEVIILQKFLNKTVDTEIAREGIGSFGEETDYFGPKTKNAVIRFQNKYANEVLNPVGLSYGTGFVGNLTRAKINLLSDFNGSLPLNNPEIIKENVLPVLETKAPNDLFPPTLLSSEALGIVSADDLFQSVITDEDVSITSLSKYEVKAGENIVMNGFGFKDANTLHIGSHTESISNVLPQTITVPSLRNGVYEVWVENSLGSSKKKSLQYIKITDNPSPQPIIKKSYPLTATFETTITATGDFDEKNNTVHSSLGDIYNVPSKNGVLSFSVTDLPEIKEKKDEAGFPEDLIVTYSVETSRGISANFGRFTFIPKVTWTKLINSFGDKVAKFFVGEEAMAAVTSKTRLHDGGLIISVAVFCTCSGGVDVNYRSYIDFLNHEYVVQSQGTIIYDKKHPITNGKFFLETHVPYAVCFVTTKDGCEPRGNPEATLTQIGTN